MKGFKTGSLLAVGIATAVVLAGCGTAAPEGGGGSDESFSIAYQGPITGGDAKYGAYAKAGIEVAIADYTEKYPDGPTVTAQYLDTQGDPAQAPPLATQAITDETILGIVGPAFSGETEATEPAYAEAGLVNVSPSATRVSLTDQGWDTFHRVVANDAAQGPAAATVLTDVVEAKAIFLIDDASAYGTGLQGEITAALDASLIVGTDSVEKGSTTDFSATVTKVTSAGADAVYYSGYAVDAGLIVKQLRDAGWDGTFMSGDGTQDTTFMATAGEAADGSLITAAAGAATADFTEKWDALDVSDKGEIGVYSTEAYDAAWVLLSGIGEGNTTREDLLAWVNGYDEDGITKHIKFAESGEIEGAGGVYYYEVVDGEFAEPVLID